VVGLNMVGNDCSEGRSQEEIWCHNVLEGT